MDTPDSMDYRLPYDAPTTPFDSRQLETIRHEFGRLGNLCYLDQLGCALYSKSYITDWATNLTSNVYGNTHSHSTVGKHCTDLVDQVRYKILQHFNTDVNEYSVIFTSGTTHSLKLIAECFKWRNDGANISCESGRFVYMEDNHTSVLGMRDLVEERGATVECLSHQETLDTLNTSNNSNGNRHTSETAVNSLFVYSAQCNFSGVKYPLKWVNRVHEGALDKYDSRSNWYCLLDVASLVSTACLDLSAVRPDFVCFSFYKIFGYPTGLGALLVRNSSAKVLNKRYYGGGTVLLALSEVTEHVPRTLLHERFEDGTLNYLSIIALMSGFKAVDNLVGNLSTLSMHTFNLAKYTFNSLLRLHHANGWPAVVLYADTAYDSAKTQGNVVNFNMLRPNGENIGFAEVLNMANMHGIQLRTGCFCNPGACRRHLGLTTDDVRKNYKAGHVCGDDNDLIEGKPTGSVRVSFGMYNTNKDVDRLVKMLSDCFVQQPPIFRWPLNWNIRRKRLKNKFRYPGEKETEENPSVERLLNGNGIHRNGFNGNIENRNSSLILPSSPTKKNTFDERNPSSSVYLSQICLYPVKSCGRFSVNKWDMDERGLKYDRQWMVTTASGVALTQKTEPFLCLLRPHIDLAGNILRLTYKGEDSISLPLERIENKNWTKEYSFCQSKVCGDRIQGYDCGEDVANWLSTIFNRPGLRLIRQLPDDTRTNKKSSGALALANQSQFLLINEASVQFLADKLDEDSDCSEESMLNRFRSNFVASGNVKQFEEQDWKEVQIGNVAFKVDSPCSRCQMICIDQDTGLTTKEPLTTLTATLRGKMKFGIYLSRLVNETESVSIYDPILSFK